MKRLLLIALLAAATLLSVLTKPAHAQVPCSVSTDKSTYTVGESVFVSGAGAPDSSATITVSDGTSLGTVGTEPSTGSFAASWDAANATPGTYTITVTMADGATCSTSLTFVVAAPPPSEEPPPGEEQPPEEEEPAQDQSRPKTCKCPEGTGGGGGRGGGGGAVAQPAGELPFTGAPAGMIGGLGLVLVSGGLLLARRRKDTT